MKRYFFWTWLFAAFMILMFAIVNTSGVNTNKVDDINCKYYYYYHKEKICLEPSLYYVLVVIKDKTDEETQQILQKLKDNFPIFSPEEYTKSYYRFKIGIVGLTLVDIENIVQGIRTDYDITYAGLVFNDGRGGFIIPTGEILVKFLPNVSEKRIKELIKDFKVKILKKEGGSYYRIAPIDRICDSLSIANKFAEQPEVKWASPNMLRTIYKYE